MSAVGSLHDKKVIKHCIDWDIDNYFSRSQKADTYFQSPRFIFWDSHWYLSLYPNGSRENETVEFVNLFLNKEKSSRNCHVDCIMGIKFDNGSVYREANFKYKFSEDGDLAQGFALVSRAVLWKEKLKLAPQNVLKVFCKLHMSDCEIGVSSTGTILGKHDTKTLTEDAVMNTEGLNILSQDLKGLFLNEEDYDVKFRVKDHDFNVHRSILTARSPVFAAMFKHNMMEKTSGIVNIVDCKPSAFKEFLCYLYSGKVEQGSLDIIIDLYSMSVKYDVEHLKELCIPFLKKELSENSFYDIMALAAKFEEKKLIKFGADFFVKNAKTILRSVKWRLFLKENPVIGNMLFLKVLNI